MQLATMKSGVTSSDSGVATWSVMGNSPGVADDPRITRDDVGRRTDSENRLSLHFNDDRVFVTNTRRIMRETAAKTATNRQRNAGRIAIAQMRVDRETSIARITRMESGNKKGAQRAPLRKA